MLDSLHSNKKIQGVLALIFGAAFGVLLHKSGATDYQVIAGQLLLTDWTVAKVVLSASVVGMVGVHFLRDKGLARFAPKSGTVGTTVLGGLIFGAGFGILGYCPGTALAASAQGSLDALFGGVPGIMAGVALFAHVQHRIPKRLLQWGDMGDITLPEVLGLRTWPAIGLTAGIVGAVFVVLELFGA